VQSDVYKKLIVRQGLRGILWVLILIALVLPTYAKRLPGYRYGEAWWEEYESDEQTALLLHFGRPQVSGRETLVEKVDENKSEDELFDLNALDFEDNETIGGVGLPERLSIEDMQQAPVDDSDVAEGVILDYSSRRFLLHIASGMELCADGYYGKGLRFTGNGALKIPHVQAGQHGSVEAWVRVESYPKRPACLWSINRDEAQLLLHPDGRLELKLKNAHGFPYKALSDTQKADIMARDASIMAPSPLPVGVWTHVMVYNKTHIVQGSPSAPWEAVLKINGSDVASYLSDRGNSYDWMGREPSDLVLGNNLAGTAGFNGTIDELRVSTANRVIYERPVLSWRDADLDRELQFDTPWFRQNGTIFHWSMDRGLTFDLDRQNAGGVELKVPETDVQGLEVAGVRGKGWVIDPGIAFPRIPITGLNTLNGSIEFWFRPINWDDVSGYWQHTPSRPPRELSVMRCYGRDTRDGTVVCFLNVMVPRCHNLERSRWPVDAGHWLHMVASWNDRWFGGGDLFVDGKRRMRVWRAKEEVLRHIEPLYAEFGITDDVTVKRGEHPLMEIDEVVAYNYALGGEEVAQARSRWQGKLKPIDLYSSKIDFKWSIQRLDFMLTPRLGPEVTPRTATVSLVDAAGKTILGPFDMKPLADAKSRIVAFSALMNDGVTLPYGAYRFVFAVRDADGRMVLEGGRDWNYEEEPWRHNRSGILETVMPPWTPIEMSDTQVKTRMSTCNLDASGLPTQIKADGQDLLSSPIQLLEAGSPMKGGTLIRGETKATYTTWSSTFTGTSCDVVMNCRSEYDGMVKYTLTVKPKREVQPLQFVIPMLAERARRFLYYPMGARGVRVGVVPDVDGAVLSSRWDPAPSEIVKAYRSARKAGAKESFNDYYAERRDQVKRYNFYGHVNVHDMNRGLWWFCDNAAGWYQSKMCSAVELERRGDTVRLVLNLVAEPVDYKSDRPIVFAMLPHPARPMVPEYRLFDRVSPDVNSWASSIYDAFATWPMNPRGHSLNMKLYPAADPKDPAGGPSWDYAERCIPSMKSNRPYGTRTLYLSKAWFSCRAGAYDNWEWRSGESSAVSLTPSFVNYLCWEMNEWIGRGIWNAIYLDECYEHPARNLLAGLSVLLPDGSEQPGVTNFEFRELMKRWRGIFVANGVKPCLMGHHTYSWQYPGLLYCDSVLDGENKPIVSLNSRDWIDSCSKPFFETVQNAKLWGLSTFYMPFIAEGGFNNKERSQHPVWQWRMARQAQSMFAHYETATVYEGQGSAVYKAYWRDLLGWGVGDLTVTFHPYWDNDAYLQVADQGGDTLVSFYNKAGKVLIIASNRSHEERELEINLSLNALGLKPGAEVRSLDSSFLPPLGDDYLGKKAMVEEADDLMERDLTIDISNTGLSSDFDMPLDDPDVLKEKKNFALEPQMIGDVLHLPVRARDYRVVVVE
jgi:hypothetical protein